MIHYHGGPITPMPVGLACWKSRHAMVSYARDEQMALAAEICQSFALDNGAFAAWGNGQPFNLHGYLRFAAKWWRHPGFDWALLPDVIDGTEEQNDELIDKTLELMPLHRSYWVPVWHLHESLLRLDRLSEQWPRVALGSSGDWSDPGSKGWWNRIAEAMEILCDKDGTPKVKIHGLRMMDPTIFSHVPFSSVDSTSVARNTGRDTKWKGPYEPLTETTRAMVLVDRIESHASANRWTGSAGVQKNFHLVG